MSVDFDDEQIDSQEDDDPTLDDAELLPIRARKALVWLLMNRFVSRARNRLMWEALVEFEVDIKGRLAELFLTLEMDERLGVAFKRQQEGDDFPKVLRKEKALSRDASLLLIMLRREFIFAADDNGTVTVTREQIGEFLRAYREDSDSDEARFERRVAAAINSLISPLQLLTPDPSADYLFTVSPVVEMLIGSDELQRLTEVFEQAASAAAESAGRHQSDSEVTA